ncbi:MBL fold metallo-hydrolase [Salsipaludibacter albus]|uniref:MBL fold metallo-hydrolase n=1 Tax=Salsipaludibacter albus TaxID=2849650 RepID=UPI001EE3AE72|nr:MBL fold metallo-hydrolase [Salsipaludibacter albus]MBY5162797.1 MBL fold metallo-hydrolase [Salsipaludibacter albus]
MDPRPTARPPVNGLTRRVLLLDLGTAAVALVLGGCTSSEPQDTPTSTEARAADTPASPGPAASGSTSGDELRWERVLGGAASAYVLVRAGQATVVDTGQAGTASALEDGLAALGVGWADVSDVVLTHRHPDHVGSLGEVADAASDATLSAGRGDLEAITADRRVVGIGDGDTVMGLQIVETPGHTPGHVSVFDPGSRVLVAGDAVNGTEDGGVAGPNEAFTPDMDTAWASAGTLATLEPRVILFGHGPPAVDDPAALLRDLVATQG